MFYQTFSLQDIPKVFVLIFLEWLLSADNAIILSVLSRSLPKNLRKKALYIGISSSFIFRAIGIVTISFFLHYAWIQIVGAIYLLFLCLRHFFYKNKQWSTKPFSSKDFWKTIFFIELIDLAFALDSILAGVAFIGSPPSKMMIHPKIWIVYVGAMLGLIGIRYASRFFATLIDRFPFLETSAYLMVGWIGLKLGFLSLLEMIELQKSIPFLQPIFWSGIILLFIVGFIGNRKINNEQEKK